MQAVTVSRELSADSDAVAAVIADVQSFMSAAGFDAVRVDDDQIRIQTRVGLFDVELIVGTVTDDECVFAYEQLDGIFEEMDTRYWLEETEDGTEITATTRFEAVDLPIVGQVLDETVVKSQRSSELNTQFDWLEAELAE